MVKAPPAQQERKKANAKRAGRGNARTDPDRSIGRMTKQRVT
jgi:hypothetical protein